YEPKLLGTAGTIIENSHRFSTKDIFIAHADNLSYFNLNEFHQRHEFRPKYTTVTMMTFETDSPSSCGILSTNSDGVMTKYVEKPKDSFFGDANGATYFFSREAIDEILNLRDAKDISKDVMPTFIGKVLTWKNTCYHRDIGTPESLKKANQEYPFIGKKKV
ncbi:MAG: mannose-1-phosphate guanylyltransferase, partial [Candidatus Pelagibacter sp.]|nr:mannose-1-phosphate guanylyltransferase [Candidatus Pelagibacter sp.]